MASKKKYKEKWDLTPLGKSINDPYFVKERKEIQKAVEAFEKRWTKDTSYLKNPNKLRTALDEYEHLYKTLGTSGKQGYYVSLKHSLDQLDTKVRGTQNHIQEFAKEMQNKLLFFELALGKIPTALQKKMLKDKALHEYKHFLEKIFEIAHYTLSDKEEKIMNLRSQTARSNWVKMVSAFLSKDQEEVKTKEGKKLLTYTEILPLLQTKDKKLRDNAAAALNKIFSRHTDAAEHELNSVLQDIKIVDTIRGLKRPDQMTHIHDDVPTEIVDMMVTTIEKHFKVAHDFYAFLAKIHGVKKLEYHERQIPYGKEEKEYSFSESVDLIKESFSQLDEEFSEIFNSFLENGQVDVYPAKGKRGGAFCAYNLPVHPTYILLNYTKKLDDVLTFAHESGHGINDELMKEKQNALNFGTPTSTAEIASTFFEGYVLQKIMEEADDETKLALLIKSVSDDISTIVRQVAADLFQRELHKSFRKKGYLSKEEIGTIFQKHMKSYMGPSVIQSEGSENWWIYWSHIRVPFYNYQYAFGFLVAKYFLKLVQEDKENIHKVKAFLSAGTSQSPYEIFKKSGLDITKAAFWEEGIKEIRTTLNETIKLAKKLGKI